MAAEARTAAVAALAAIKGWERLRDRVVLVSPLMTVEEVRVQLNIGRTLVYQLIWSGALPVVRIGRALRVRGADLDAYVDAQVSCQPAR